MSWLSLLGGLAGAIALAVTIRREYRIYRVQKAYAETVKEMQQAYRTLSVRSADIVPIRKAVN